MKELVHAFSGAYIELWMHLGSLESTQKANSYASFVLFKLPACIHVTRYTQAEHEPIRSAECKKKKKKKKKKTWSTV